jgi:predicted nucleotidyltransferase
VAAAGAAGVLGAGVSARSATDSAALPDLAPIVAELRHPLVFATVSGAHLYGFPSADSDVDLRGVHLLPARNLVGLRPPAETMTRMWDRDGVEMDLVTHDAAKFARLLLRPNGYVLEQLLSPLVVHSTTAHAELISHVPGLLTSRHAEHYQGFAATQLRLFAKTGQLKPLLYTFRVLLTGIHLMRTGRVVAHLPTLIEQQSAPVYLRDLIAAKAHAEHMDIAQLPSAPRPEQLNADVTALRAELDDAQRDTHLPAQPAAEAAINELIIRTRVERGWP